MQSSFLVLFLLLGVCRAFNTRHLTATDNCTFIGFEQLNNTSGGRRLTCATVNVSSGLSVSWAFDEQLYVDFLRLGIEAPPWAASAAVAFPQVAAQQPQLPGATAMVLHPCNASEHNASSSTTPCMGGVTFQQFLVGSSWADLQPSSAFNVSMVAGGRTPGGGMYGVLEVPAWQMNVPTFGTHWPIRQIPLLFALAGSDTQPAVTGSFVLAVSSGDLFGEPEVMVSSAAAARGDWQRAAAASGAAGLLLLGLL